MRRTSDDPTTPLSRAFAALSAGGNLGEPHPRPSANCLLSAGVCGLGRGKGVPESASITSAPSSVQLRRVRTPTIRRWRAAQVVGEAERYGARNRGGRLPAASREHRSMWPSSSRSGTSGCLSGNGARRPVCSADCYRAAVGEKGGGPRMVIPRGFAVADAWRRARSTRSAVSSVAGSLAPR